MKYRPEIDGLRTLAVIPVILFHAGFAWFGGGFVGVDVFFVISGYLITTIIINELDLGEFSLSHFYERRARRILPALFFVMLLCTPVAWVLMLPGELQDFSQSVIAVATFSSNILFWLESGYFDTAAELKPLLHTWSLAVEEQYYILFPLFLMVAWRLGRTRILLLLAIVFAISLSVAQWGSYASPDAAFFLLPTRGWELLIGVFAAFHLQKNGHGQSATINQACSLLGLVLILLSVSVFDKSTPFPGLYALAPTLGTVLLILFAVEGTFAHRMLCLKWMVGIGLISYSAYLWHQPLLVFLRLTTAEQPNLLLVIAACLLSFVLAGLSFRFVERPFRNKQFLSSGRVFISSSSMVLLFVVVGATMLRADANLSRYETRGYAGEIGHTIYHDYVQANNYSCEPGSIYSQAETWDGFVRCQQSSEGAPKIVLFGDSHAEHLFVGISEQLENTGVVYYIRGGYPFVGERNFDYLIDYINSNADIDYVIFAGYWYRTIAVLGTDKFQRELNETIAAFKSANKQVVLISDVPDFGFDPANCNFSNRFRVSSCEITAEEFAVQKESYAPIFTGISNSQNAEVISIDDIFCDTQACSMIKNNTILYRDNDHLNRSGSRLAAQMILQRSSILGKLLSD